MLTKEHFQTQGENVTIGICDTGLKTTLSCFRNCEIQYKTFGMTGERHGTHIASTILQFVPKARIVFAGGIMDSYAKLESMLEWVSQFKIDVLNLSLAFPEKDEKISLLLKELASRKTLIVCAQSDTYPFPWSEEYTISAGRNGEFSAPMEWTAYSSSGYKTIMRGSSVSTALTTALCALCKARNPDLTKEAFLTMASPEDIKPLPRTFQRQKNLKL